MANFTFLDPTGSNLSGNRILPSLGVTTMRITRDNIPWIYTNYPEKIVNKTVDGLLPPLGDNDYFLNQQTINDTAAIFFSHTNGTGRVLKYGVQIYNNNASSITVTRDNCGFSQGWGLDSETVTNYFDTDGRKYTLRSGASAWILSEEIDSGKCFSGMLHISTTGPVVVTLYAYFDLSALTGYAVAYPFTDGQKVYSGRGEGFFNYFTHGTVKVSDLPYRCTTNRCKDGYLNINEIIPIHLVGSDIIASVNNPQYHNLGNWCAQNYHSIRLTNDTSSQVTIYGYFSANQVDNDGAGNVPVINCGGILKISKLNSDTGYYTWRWCRITLAAGESYDLSFQHILSSNGHSAGLFEWSLA